MSESVLGLVLWATIAVGWIGFLIILGALVREAYGWLRSRAAHTQDTAEEEPR